MSDGRQKEGQQSVEDMPGFNEKNLRPLEDGKGGANNTDLFMLRDGEGFSLAQELLELRSVEPAYLFSHAAMTLEQISAIKSMTVDEIIMSGRVVTSQMQLQLEAWSSLADGKARGDAVAVGAAAVASRPSDAGDEQEEDEAPSFSKRLFGKTRQVRSQRARRPRRSRR